MPSFSFFLSLLNPSKGLLHQWFFNSSKFLSKSTGIKPPKSLWVLSPFIWSRMMAWPKSFYNLDKKILNPSSNDINMLKWT